MFRFCTYQYQHYPLAVLVERWGDAEAVGLDVVWNLDSMTDPDQARTVMFEATTTLAAMALHTSRIRVGTLVASPFCAIRS